MDIKKIFNDKLIIIVAVIFIMASMLDVLFASIVQRGIMYDGSIWFPELLSKIGINNTPYFEINWYGRSRGFINLINEIPLNIAVLLFHIKSKYILSVIFSFPLFFNTFLCLIFQYLLTLRSKRTDIFLSALCLQTAIIIPISMYSIVEISLAAAILLLLYHYLVADIEFKIYDYIFIFLLTVISYLSNEVLVYLGIIMFLISLYYTKKADSIKKKIVKLFIGCNCLIISFFQFYCLRFLANSYDTHEKVMTQFLGSFVYFSSYYFTIDILLILLIIFVLFKKSRFKFILVFSLLFAEFVFYSHIIYNFEFMTTFFFQKRYIPYLFLPFAVIVNTLFDVFGNNYNKERMNTIFYNLCLVLFIIGILNIAFSYTNSYVFFKKVKEFKEITTEPKFEGRLISPAVDMKNFYLNDSSSSYLFNCDTYIYDQLNFSDEYKLETFLTPFEQKNTPCPQKFYFDSGFLFLPFNKLPIKNSYWDLTEIEKIINNNKTYKSKYKAGKN